MSVFLIEFGINQGTVVSLKMEPKFGGQLLAFLWDETVPHYWLTCFSVPIRTSF